jgi:hypothetical protein
VQQQGDPAVAGRRARPEASGAGRSERWFTRLPVFVAALVVCQDVFRDERGRTHLHAVFDNLNATGFPVTTQFMVWCSLRGRGSARVVLKVVDMQDAMVTVTDAVAVDVTPFRGHDMFFTFTLTLASEGLYRVVAFVDGIPGMETPLLVRLQGSQESAG